MSAALEKYEKLVTLGRVIGTLAAASAGALFLIEEPEFPALYSAVFYAFVLIMLSLIVLTIYTARFKRRNEIHRHG